MEVTLLDQGPPPQVSVGSSSLSSMDVFLLLAPSGCWLWRGKSSTSMEA